MLPSEWKRCNLWAIYTEIFRKNVLGEGFTKPDVGRYCGSGTIRLGVEQRLNAYVSADQGIRKPKNGSHGRRLVRKDVRMNLRVPAVFNQCKTPKPYVMLMELLSSILLQTFPQQSSGEYRRVSTVDMIQRATPQDLPEAKHEPLNRAAQCLQGLWYRQSKNLG